MLYQLALIDEAMLFKALYESINGLIYE